MREVSGRRRSSSPTPTAEPPNHRPWRSAVFDVCHGGGHADRRGALTRNKMHRFTLRLLLLAVLCLPCLLTSPAQAAKKPRAKAAAPSGTPTAKLDESGGYTRLDTVQQVQNAAGQTVYSI